MFSIVQQLLYLEIPTPDTAAVRAWLQHDYAPPAGQKETAPHGFVLRDATDPQRELTAFVWSLQRTTYLKAFRWSAEPMAGEARVLQHLTASLRAAFPHRYPELPDLAPGQSIFEALRDRYPLTAKFFARIPNGEYDLQRAYWWEKRWREGVRTPQQPREVVVRADALPPEAIATPEYDIAYVGGALGAIHAAMMAKLGYRVCLLERLHFGRMNREWNISRQEFEGLIEFGLFTRAEFESIIACEYRDGFNKFFDGNNPPVARAPVLHTPTVLNIAIDTSKLLALCGEKLRQYGADIRDRAEFEAAIVAPEGVAVRAKCLDREETLWVRARLLVDAMGSASAIAQQINGGQAFDSVCPTVGAVLEGIDDSVWDRQYGDVLFSHGDISRGRQLIWELFPGEGKELTVYLFHYHQVHPDNPGSLLELYEDFFAILPEYRRCDMEALTWKKAAFGYIPGRFGSGSRREQRFDRFVAIGDAAALQSPLVFTGFGSLVRNLPRLADLLDTALRHDLLFAADLGSIDAFQSNVAVTWLFSKGMMVPTGRHLPPERVNAMLNTFFGTLAAQPPEVSDRFIKDRVGWGTFLQLALVSARKNFRIIPWIWEMAGTADMVRWLASFWQFTLAALLGVLFGGWVPPLLDRLQPWLEPRSPRLWLTLLRWSYALTYSLGKPRLRRLVPTD